MPWDALMRLEFEPGMRLPDNYKKPTAKCVDLAAAL